MVSCLGVYKKLKKAYTTRGKCHIRRAINNKYNSLESASVTRGEEGGGGSTGGLTFSRVPHVERADPGEVDGPRLQKRDVSDSTHSQGQGLVRVGTIRSGHLVAHPSAIVDFMAKVGRAGISGWKTRMIGVGSAAIPASTLRFDGPKRLKWDRYSTKITYLGR